jgi:hypothetical protein
VSDRDDLERALRLLAAEQHPDGEDLTAYQAGELEGERAEEVRGHVAGCEACRDRMAELAMFLEGPAAPPGREAAAAWQRLQRRLESETWRDGTPFRRTGFLDRLRAAPPLLRAGYVLAGAAIAAVVGLAVWTGVQEPVRTLAALNLVGMVRGSAEVETIRLQPGTDEVDLQLRLESGTSFPTYRVVIADETGERVQEERGLKARDGVVSVAVPRRRLEVGTVYVVQVFGPGDRAEDEAGQVLFRLAE